jgi:hypothetical protein
MWWNRFMFCVLVLWIGSCIEVSPAHLPKQHTMDRNADIDLVPLMKQLFEDTNKQWLANLEKRPKSNVDFRTHLQQSYLKKHPSKSK